MHSFYYSVKLNRPGPLLEGWNTVTSGLYLICGLATMLAIQSCFLKFGYNAYRLKHFCSFTGIVVGAFLLPAILSKSNVVFPSIITIASAGGALIAYWLARRSESADAPSAADVDVTMAAKTGPTSQQTSHIESTEAYPSFDVRMWGLLIPCVVAGLLIGAILGALTNMINGFVSPTYFVSVMRWDHLESVWRASVVQGTIEGTVYGAVFSALFIAFALRHCNYNCRISVALRYLVGIAAATFCCWVAGGIIGIMTAAISPEFWRETFVGVPENYQETLAYAWVGGSIQAGVFGGLATVGLGVMVFRHTWTKSNKPFASR